MVLLIQFVTQANEWKALGVAWTRVLDKATLPFVKIFERLLICKVVAEGTTVGTSIERVSQRLELFLTCGVPNLKRHNRVIHEDLLFAKVGANRRLALP